MSKWDARYREMQAQGASAARVLLDHLHLLPARGRALDLACGLGGNALVLASRGLDTSAWDISPVAIEHVRAAAQAMGLAVDAQVRDVMAAPPEPESFDVIVVSRFLERALAPRLMDALRPRGLLFYQTFTRERVSERGPRTEAFRLGDNELLALFAPLQLVSYREEGRIGDLQLGFRDEAMLVAQKRASTAREGEL